jgi:hypothetical protein
MPRGLLSRSREDVLSKWINKVLTREITGDDRWFERTLIAADGVRSQAKGPAQSLAGIKVPVVCHEG